MKNTRILYLVRHGEVRNPNNLCYSRLPRFGLNEMGVLQSKHLKKYFKDKKVVAVVSSPLLRCRQTARLSFPEKKLIISRYFNEVDYSKWEGLKFSDRDPKDVETWKKDPSKIDIGETLATIEDRCVRGLRRYLHRFPKGDIVIFSHAAPIKILLTKLKGGSSKEIVKETCSNASIQIVTLNDNHFKNAKFVEIYPHLEEFY